MTATLHTAADGRTFRVNTRRCIHDAPCWAAWCQCGQKLTQCDFTAESAEAGAREVMASTDPRRGFGHARCGG